jgi:hypothetical protein
MYYTSILSMSEEFMDVLHKHPKYVRGWMYNTSILSMSEELMDVLHKHPRYVRGIDGCTTQAS